MKKLAFLSILSTASIFYSAYTYSGTCEIHITRTACAGKEEISYKKCDGSQSCSEFVEAISADDCGKQAAAACENKRTEITKSKVITAKFEGAEIKTTAGRDDFCTVYAAVDKEFNQCPK